MKNIWSLRVLTCLRNAGLCALGIWENGMLVTDIPGGLKLTGTSQSRMEGTQ
jgi:hypothetical protein